MKQTIAPSGNGNDVKETAPEESQRNAFCEKHFAFH
jgi:hypothetical protein